MHLTKEETQFSNEIQADFDAIVNKLMAVTKPNVVVAQLMFMVANLADDIAFATDETGIPASVKSIAS